MDKEQERKLDSAYLRVHPIEHGKLEWVERPEIGLGEMCADELAGKLDGVQAWVFGKGPSLDQFDFDQAGVVRVCLNESVLVVPEPSYCFFMDRDVGKDLYLPEGCSPVVPPGCRNLPRSFDDTKFIWDWAKHCRPNYATAACCIWLLGLWGVRSIVMVGFDSMAHELQHDGQPKDEHQYAGSIGQAGGRTKPFSNYHWINDHIRECVTEWDIEAKVWISEDQEPLTVL